MGEQELGVGEILCGKVYIVLINHLYNIGRNLKGDHAEYDVLGSRNVYDVARVQEAHGHLFCSALQFSFLRKALPAKKKQASSRDDSGEIGSESKETESVYLWPAFAVKNFALHYL